MLPTIISSFASVKFWTFDVREIVVIGLQPISSFSTAVLDVIDAVTVFAACAKSSEMSKYGSICPLFTIDLTWTLFSVPETGR